MSDGPAVAAWQVLATRRIRREAQLLIQPVNHIMQQAFNPHRMVGLAAEMPNLATRRIRREAQLLIQPVNHIMQQTFNPHRMVGLAAEMPNLATRRIRRELQLLIQPVDHIMQQTFNPDHVIGGGGVAEFETVSGSVDDVCDWFVLPLAAGFVPFPDPWLLR